MFQGTITALITPFKESQSGQYPAIDFDSLEQVVEWHLQCKINGFVACGTSAEAPTLGSEEQFSIIRRVVEIVNKRVPVLAGTGTNDTRHTVELTRAAKELGADGALVVAPYYNRPSQEGLFAHYQEVARSGGLPIVLYDIPKRSGVELEIDTISRLAEVDGIVGIKECTDSSRRMMELARAVGDSLTVLSGDDDNIYPVLALGGKGVISAAANVIPKEIEEITSHGMAGRFRESCAAQLKLQPVLQALFAEVNPTGVKAALAMTGRISTDVVRLPLVSVSDTTRERIAAALGLSK